MAAIPLSLNHSILSPAAEAGTRRRRFPFSGRVIVRAMVDPRPPPDSSNAAKVAEGAKYLVWPSPMAPLVEGRKYLNMLSGLSENPLGFQDRDWARDLEASGWGFPSIAPMEELERCLVASSFADRVFFSNSEDNANVEAIEVARSFHMFSNPDAVEPATESIAFTNCFLGRTALALTPQGIYIKPLERLMPSVTLLEYGNIQEAVECILSGKIASVFVEPITATKEFLQALRRACNEAGSLLVYDEVQCGLGRTGFLWAYEAQGVLPDVMILGSPLAGGLPFGAVLLNQKVASAFLDYDSSFRAPSLMCKPAMVLLDKISKPEFLLSVSKKGDHFQRALVEKLGGNSHVRDVRGKGLIIDVEFDVPASPFVDACQDSGLLLSCQASGVLVSTFRKDNVVRLAPALFVSEDELDRAVDIMLQCLPVFD